MKYQEKRNVLAKRDEILKISRIIPTRARRVDCHVASSGGFRLAFDLFTSRRSELLLHEAKRGYTQNTYTPEEMVIPRTPSGPRPEILTES